MASCRSCPSCSKSWIPTWGGNKLPSQTITETAVLNQILYLEKWIKVRLSSYAHRQWEPSTRLASWVNNSRRRERGDPFRTITACHWKTNNLPKEGWFQPNKCTHVNTFMISYSKMGGCSCENYMITARIVLKGLDHKCLSCSLSLPLHVVE